MADCKFTSNEWKSLLSCNVMFHTCMGQPDMNRTLPSTPSLSLCVCVAVLLHSIGPAVQALLQASDEPGGVASLIKQVSMATVVLPQNPGLYRVALGVLASAYHSHAHQPEQV